MGRCKGCGAEISNEKYCQYCGKKSHEYNESKVLVETLTKESDNTIPENIEEQTNQQNKRNMPVNKNIGCMVLIIMFIGAFAIIGIIAAISSSLENRIINGTNIPSEKAKAVIAVLNQCDITDILSIKHDDKLDNVNEKGEKGYRIGIKDLDGMVLYLNKEGNVNLLVIEDSDLFANGKVFSKIFEYMFTNEEKRALKDWCIRAIAPLVKAPATASFPIDSEWKFSKSKQRIVVKAYFYFDNNKGNMVKSTFQIIFTPDKNNVTSFVIDGKEYIKQ